MEMTKNEKIKRLKELIEEKKLQLDNLKKQADSYNSMQLALKLILNGSYGAFANKHFVCFCNGVASTITAHGRDLIKIMDRAGNHYFKKKWHLDTDLHKILGVSDVKQIPAETECCVYVDTDSNFFTMKPAMDSCGWEGNPLEFLHLVCKHRLSGYFKDVLELYAKKYKVKNVQDFELEQASKSIIFLEKKMYVKNVVWEDGSPNDANPEWQKKGTYFLHESNIQSKGIDLVRTSSPLFARQKVYDVINYFFKNPSTYNDRDLVKIVRELKNEFKIANIEDISMSSSCNNYANMVLNDQTTLKIAKGAHHAVKAAALHNYLLNNNPQFKNKYNLIKSGTRIKYYYTTNQISNEFAYVAGQYPKEIAMLHAPIDYDTQFEKCILSLINRFNNVLGLSKLDSKLTFTLSLF
jgi:DNA polymerase elongation subunit (family B)